MRVHDRIFGDFSAKSTVYRWLWPTLYLLYIMLGGNLAYKRLGADRRFRHSLVPAGNVRITGYNSCCLFPAKQNKTKQKKFVGMLRGLSYSCLNVHINVAMPQHACAVQVPTELAIPVILVNRGIFDFGQQREFKYQGR